MPDMNLPAPSTCPVGFGEGCPVRENSVVVRKVEGLEVRRRSDRAMVCVVKENANACSALTIVADAPDQLRLIPFVYQNEVARVEHFIYIDRVRRICLAAKLREGAVKTIDGLRPVIPKEVLAA